MGLSHFILRRNTLKIPKGQSESENTMKKKHNMTNNNLQDTAKKRSSNTNPTKNQGVKMPQCSL